MAKGDLLTLDLGARTGWACGPTGSRALPRSSWQQISKPGMSDGAAYAALSDWLDEMITVFDPEIVCFEAPFVGGKGSQQSALRLLGYASQVERVCYLRRRRIFSLNIATVKKFFTKNGRAEKADMIFAAKGRGHVDVTDSNEADALGGWYYSRETLANRVTVR